MHSLQTKYSADCETTDSFFLYVFFLFLLFFFFLYKNKQGKRVTLFKSIECNVRSNLALIKLTQLFLKDFTARKLASLTLIVLLSLNDTITKSALVTPVWRHGVWSHEAARGLHPNAGAKPRPLQSSPPPPHAPPLYNGTGVSARRTPSETAALEPRG